MHNTFDVSENGGIFLASSHNFPEFSGEGTSREEAITSLNRAIIHYIDNNPVEYNRRIRDRIKRGLKCECGEKLDGPIVAIAGQI